MTPAEMDAFVAREIADNLRGDQGGGDQALTGDRCDGSPVHAFDIRPPLTE